jgi:hypothetical protein
LKKEALRWLKQKRRKRKNAAQAKAAPSGAANLVLSVIIGRAEAVVFHAVKGEATVVAIAAAEVPATVVIEAAEVPVIAAPKVRPRSSWKS